MAILEEKVSSNSITALCVEVVEDIEMAIESFDVKITKLMSCRGLISVKDDRVYYYMLHARLENLSASD